MRSCATFTAELVNQAGQTIPVPIGVMEGLAEARWQLGDACAPGLPESSVKLTPRGDYTDAAPGDRAANRLGDWRADEGL
jgi:hypothetical protein